MWKNARLQNTAVPEGSRKVPEGFPEAYPEGKLQFGGKGRRSQAHPQHKEIQKNRTDIREGSRKVSGSRSWCKWSRKTPWPFLGFGVRYFPIPFSALSRVENCLPFPVRPFPVPEGKWQFGHFPIPFPALSRKRFPQFRKEK